MTPRDWIILIAFPFFLVVIFLLRRTSLEGKFIMAFALLAFGTFLRLHFYLLLLTSLALFTFIAVARIWSVLASAAIAVRRELQKEALVGENLPVRYGIVSRSPFPLYHVRVWDRAYRNRSSSDIELVPFEDPGYLSFLRVGPEEKSEAVLHVTPGVRGLLNLGPIAVEGSDPFGIFTPIRWIATGAECLVFPTWVMLSALPSIPAKLGIREQNHLISREGQSHELLGVRVYSEGDSLRRVHWPLTAKHDELIVRQFEREVEEEMLVILDADRIADMGEGAENAIEYLITLASSLVHTASELGRRWTFVVVGPEVETFSHRTKEALLSVQYALARLEANREAPIEEFLDGIRKEHPNSACALLTPRTDSASAVALAKGDSTATDIHSLIIRIDPDTFASGIDDGLKAMKRRRVAPRKPAQPIAQGPALPQVNEILIKRGENLADLFLSRALA